MCDKAKLVLGTMTFGERIFDEEVVASVLEHFLENGQDEIDTAYVYNNGESERLLGAALQSVDRNRYKIDTKVNPRISGRLDKEAVLFQAEKSIARLGVEYVDTLYLHFPDPETPVESALEGCAELYEKGKIKELGLSNFPAWLVAEVYHICNLHGWMLPKVYEGLYNPLSRHAERELNKALDYYGMKFYAYNPLAGGLLTNKYSGEKQELVEGRFTTRPNYQQRYWKDTYFKAIDQIKKVCAKYDMNIVEAAYRWLAYHSMLKQQRGDAIIIGISKLDQLEQNMTSIKNGELPEEIVNVINQAWDISRVDAPEYFKYFVPAK